MPLLNRSSRGFGKNTNAQVTDVNIKNTAALITGETPAKTFITDSSIYRNQVVLNGTARPSKFSPYASGFSIELDGFNDSISGPGQRGSYAAGTSDFTVEMWVCPWIDTVSPNVNRAGLFSTNNNGGTTAGMAAFIYNPVVTPGGGFCSIGWSIAASGDIITDTAGGAIPLKVWSHLAFVRKSDIATIYINGLPIVTATKSNNLTEDNLRIGRMPDTGYLFPGFISNFRFVIGTAIYTGRFIPPRQPLTSVANTRVLACQSNRIIDTSNTQILIANANPKVSFAHPFDLPHIDKNAYGSMFIDGTGNTVTVPAPHWSTYTLPFTLEMWIYIEGALPNNKIVVGPAISNTLSFYVNASGNWTINRFGTGDILTTTTKVVGRQWTHVAITRDAANLLRFWVNGVVVASTTYTQTFTQNDFTIGNDTQIYVSDFRVVYGNPVYTANVAAPSAPLLPIANTQLLIGQTYQPTNNHSFFDGSWMNEKIVKTGNPFYSSVSPYGDNWSVYFSGKDYYTLPFLEQYRLYQFPATIEFWCNIQQSDSNTRGIISHGVNISPFTGWQVVVINGKIEVQTNDGLATVSGIRLRSTIEMRPGTWHFIRITKTAGEVWSLYQNGVFIGSATHTQSTYNNSDILEIGTSVAISNFVGYISNLRVIRGHIVNDVANSVPTVSLTNIIKDSPVPGSNVVLLTAVSNSLRDLSLYNNRINPPTGGDAVPTVVKYGPFVSSKTVPISYSYVSSPPSKLQFTANSFQVIRRRPLTIEWWMYQTGNVGVDSYLWGNDIACKIDAQGRLNLVRPGFENFAIVPAPYTGPTYWENRWCHVAVTKSDEFQWNVYLNGANVFGTQHTQEYTGADFLHIGAASGDAGTVGAAFSGFISNFRVTRSTLYQSNFTPPNEPLQLTGDTLVLTAQDPTMTGKSNFDPIVPVSASGRHRVSTFNPFGYKTIPGNARYDANLFGGSIYFDGQGDYLTVNTNRHQTLSNAFTIQGWFNATSKVTGNIAIVSKGTVNTGWEVGIGRANTLLFTNATVAFASTTPIKFNEWNHFAVVRDHKDFVKVFLNGNLEVTGGMRNPYFETANIKIGSGRVAGANVFTGYISGIRIDNNDILYSNNFIVSQFVERPSSNTIFYLDHVPGIIDYSGTLGVETTGSNMSRSLFIEGAWTENVANSIFFNGTSDFLTLTNSTNFDQDVDFTIEMWIYALARPGSNDAKFYHPQGNSGSGGLLALALDPAGKIVVDDQQTGNKITSVLALNNNQWYHVALTRSGNTLTLYIDGSSSNGGSVSYTNWQSIADFVVVGKRVDTSTFFNGYVTNLRVIRGAAFYASNFVAPRSPLAVVRNTSFLGLQSSALVDISPYANTTFTSSLTTTAGNTFSPFSGLPIGNVIYDSTIFFDGTNYLKTVPFFSGPFGESSANPIYPGNTASYTMEASIFPVADNTTMYLFTIGQEAAYRFNVHLVNGYLTTSAFGAASANLGFPKIQPNTWTHVALVRTSNIFYGYVNGSLLRNVETNAQNLLGNGRDTRIGSDGNGSSVFKGYMKDIRFTNGVSRYGSNTIITPSRIAFQKPSINTFVSLVPKPNVDYVIVGGGGAGGTNAGSGGGGGGFLQGTFTYYPGILYSIVVGAGGATAGTASDSINGSTGSNSYIFGLTAFGGGAGGSGSARGFTGGSGGGTPSEATPLTPVPGYFTGDVFTGGQGFAGGIGPSGTGLTRTTGGGGGASQTGRNGAPGSPVNGGKGGDGAPTWITGSNIFLAGGGGGGVHNGHPSFPAPIAQGGLGGGGAAGWGGSNSGFQTVGYNGNVNTGGGGGGGGGGGAGPSGLGGAGASGIVILRHPAEIKTAVTTGSNVLVTRTSSNVVYQFYSSGTIRFDNSELFTINPTTLPFSAPADASGVGNGGTPTNYPALPPGGSTPAPTPSPSPSPSPAPVGLSSVSYLMVAGGGGSGYNAGSGGGGGGSLFSTTPITLNTPYTVTVGGGGTGGPGNDAQAGTNGSNTTVFGLIAVGGGAGGAGTNIGTNGGSGSGTPGPEAGPEGATARLGYGYPGTAGTTQQGFPGGIGSGSGASRGAGGGGGGGGFGLSPSPTISGGGGPGANSSISGSLLSYGGGGGGGTHQGITGGYGGPGGGGRGGSPSPTISTQGQTNSGGGGGGGSGFGGSSTNGGSGIVIITHPTAFTQASTTGSNVTYSVVNTERVYTFYSSGDITFL